MSWRNRVASLLDRLGVLEAALRARGRVGLPLLTVLTYHRVSDPDPGAASSDAHGMRDFDPGVIDATLGEFDEQIAMLSRSFSLVSVAQLHAYFTAGRPLPQNPALITFDDGYLDCHDQALPILKRHGAAAVFFVSTKYITDRTLFWWDRISYLVKKTTRERMRLAYPLPLDLDVAGDRGFAVKTLLRIVKDCYDLDLERFLRELTEASGVAWNPEIERGFADALLMRWEHVHALRAAGMDVQSHTRTHRILQTLPAAQLAAELRESRAELEAELREPIRAVAYPVGYSIAAEPRIRAAVRDAGYSLGFSNGSGINLLSGGADPLDLHRIAVESSVPSSYFRAAVTFPLFAHKQRVHQRRGIIRS